jgi:hypothetical protein
LDVGTDLAEVVEVRPARREPNQDAARADYHRRCDFDQQRPPGAGLALAQRIALPPQPLVAPAGGLKTESRRSVSWSF